MKELIQEAQKGNKEAFTKIVVNIEQDLYKIARMRFSCEADIEDAVQDTIIQAFKSIRKVKHPEYFKTWIIKILINNCNKLYRKKNKDFEFNNELLESSLYYDNNEDLISSLDFKLLLSDLNYKERISITLYFLEDLTTKEISKILKEPDSTIRNRISRAKKKIKKNFKEENHE